MEVKITISDTESPSSPAVSVSGAPTESGFTPGSSTPDAATASDAIDAGPAPAALAATGTANAPLPFVTGSEAHPATALTSPDQSAGPAPAV